MVDNNDDFNIVNKKHNKGVKHGCEHCEYKTTQKGSLLKHVQSVHKEVIYSCKHCDYKSKQKGHLLRHV